MRRQLKTEEQPRCGGSHVVGSKECGVEDDIGESRKPIVGGVVRRHVDDGVDVGL